MLKTAFKFKWSIIFSVFLCLVINHNVLGKDTPYPAPTNSRNNTIKKLAQLEPIFLLNLEQKRAAFKQARTCLKQEKYLEAKYHLLKLIDQYNVLGDYVYHYLAQSQSKLEDHMGAINSWSRLILEFPYSRLIPKAKLGIADSYHTLKDYQKASKLYEKLLNKHWKSKNTKIGIYKKLADCYEQSGDISNALDTYHKIWLFYPASSEAVNAQEKKIYLSKRHLLSLPKVSEKAHLNRIERLMKQGRYSIASMELEEFSKSFPTSSYIPQVLYKQAKCFKRRNMGERQIDYLKKIIKYFPNHKLAFRSRYKLARIYWNNDQDETATNYLNDIIKDNKAKSWHDNSYYILARIYEENQNYNQAIEFYNDLIKKYPSSSLINISRWRAGWILYCHLKNYMAAGEYFAKIRNPSCDLYHAALYWQGRCWEELKEWNKAVSLYNSLIEQVNHTYYAQLAKERLRSFSWYKAAAPVNYSAAYAQSRISLSADPFSIEKFLVKEDIFHLERVKELADLLMFDDSLAELNKIVAPSYFSTDYWYHLSRLNHLLGNYRKSIILIQRILNKARAEHVEIPLDIWKLCYPLNYWPLIEKQARKNQLNPYLITAVIRQESVFVEDAVSVANAVGLMQIIPPTAKVLAKKLKIRKFRTGLLYEP